MNPIPMHPVHAAAADVAQALRAYRAALVEHSADPGAAARAMRQIDTAAEHLACASIAAGYAPRSGL